MLGTQMPTKMAWSSFSRRNQILTLRTKLRNAAIIKKYLLLNFMFFLGGLGFKLHERFLICESVSRMLFLPRFRLRMPDMRNTHADSARNVSRCFDCEEGRLVGVSQMTTPQKDCAQALTLQHRRGGCLGLAFGPL